MLQRADPGVRERPRRVVHLTSVHVWNDTRIYQNQCRALAGAGYDVVLVAPNAQDATDIDGVRVASVRGSANRLLRMVILPVQLARAALKERPDVVHVHDPELLPLALLMRAYGLRIVYDVHEDYRATIADKAWLPRPFRQAAAAAYSLIERAACGALAGIVCAWPALYDRLSPIARRAVLVQNFPRKRSHNPSAQRRSLNVCYAGIITQERAILELLDAIGSIATEHPGITLHLLGRFIPRELEHEARRHPAWRFVQYYGWCDADQVERVMSRCAMGIVLLKPLRNHMHSQPNKLFEYMRDGLPVIASDRPMLRHIVQSAHCGLLVDESSAAAIAQAIRHLVENATVAAEMGDAGRRAVATHLNWESEAHKLLRFYEDVCAFPRENVPEVAVALHTGE